MPSTMSEYNRKMDKIYEFLGGKCVICGRTESLHVDHIDHTTKSFNIANNWGRAWSHLEPELAKCQLLCAEHHLEKSRSEGSLAKGWTNEPRQVHGTLHSYTKYKCRCDGCKKAKSVAMKRQYINKR